MSDVCPKCGSSNVEVGAVVLSCSDCGWHHLNGRRCAVCGGQSESVMTVDGRLVYRCRDHAFRLDEVQANFAKFMRSITGRPATRKPHELGAE